MKKIISRACQLAYSLLIIFIFISASTVWGQGEATEAGQINKPKYDLPYAGVLPDHPLYFLKTVRDRVIDFLIADRLKKAEFTLVQADKRLVAAIALVDKGKPELAEQTMSKGQNYLFRSIGEGNKAKAEGKDVTAYTAKFRSALVKHEEVLRQLAGKTNGATKDRFNSMAEKVAKQRQSSIIE